MLVRSLRSGVIALSIVGTALTVDRAAADDVAGLLRPSYERWSGVYAGALLGTHDVNTSGIFDGVEPAGTPDLRNIGGEGWHGGILVGAGWQWEKLVLAVEADASWGGFEKSYLTIQDGSVAEAGLLSYPIVGDLDYLATIRGRVGFDAGDLFAHDVLLFVTGGVAFTRFEMDIADGRSTVGFDATGAVVGGGFEIALSKQWSLGAEYLYYTFNRQIRFSDAVTSGIFDANDGNYVELGNVNAVRTTLKFSFDG